MPCYIDRYTHRHAQTYTQTCTQTRTQTRTQTYTHTHVGVCYSSLYSYTCSSRNTHTLVTLMFSTRDTSHRLPLPLDVTPGLPQEIRFLGSEIVYVG